LFKNEDPAPRRITTSACFITMYLRDALKYFLCVNNAAARPENWKERLYLYHETRSDKNPAITGDIPKVVKSIKMLLSMSIHRCLAGTLISNTRSLPQDMPALPNP
jgi:hypothetical protein